MEWRMRNLKVIDWRFISFNYGNQRHFEIFSAILRFLQANTSQIIKSMLNETISFNEIH